MLAISAGDDVAAHADAVLQLRGKSARRAAMRAISSRYTRTSRFRSRRFWRRWNGPACDRSDAAARAGAGGRGRHRTPAKRDLRLRRARSSTSARRSSSATFCSESSDSGRQENQDRLGDRRRSAARARARVPDLRAAFWSIAKSRSSRTRTSTSFRSSSTSATDGCTRFSIRRAPRPGGCRRPIRICRNSGSRRTGTAHPAGVRRAERRLRAARRRLQPDRTAA